MTIGPIPDFGDDGRWDVPNTDVLRRLVTDDLPLALKTTGTARSFLRDIYFDTEDSALRERGVTCLVRHASDDRHRLFVSVVDEVGASASVRRAEADVAGDDPMTALAGGSEPARLLRAIVNPASLGARLELETQRMARGVESGGLWRRATFALAYDTVTVRTSAIARPFREVTLHALTRGRPSASEVGDALRERYGLRSVALDRQQRGGQLLAALESESLARRVGGGRWVAVLALDGSALACVRDGATWKLPVLEGGGEEACRHVMREVLGSSVGDLHLLSTREGDGRIRSLEVWVATRVDLSAGALGTAALAWLPIEQMLARIGTPEIVDAATLAALATVAKSDALPRLLSLPSAISREHAGLPAHLGRADAVRAEAASADVLRADTLRRDARSDLPYLDGDVSLIAFNQRVLALAQDETTPLLERLRYLAIVTTNLDEFFAVRAGSLKYDGATSGDEADTTSVASRRARLNREARALIAAQYDCAERALAVFNASGVPVRAVGALSDRAHDFIRAYFRGTIFPYLTPRAITTTPGHSLPVVEDRALCFAVIIRDASSEGRHLAELALPASLPRFLELPDGEGYVALEEVIRHHVALLYPGRRVEHAHLFRVTRYADLDLDEQRAGNLVQAVDERARQRRHRPIVRLEVERAMPNAVRELLLRELALEPGARPGALGDADVFDVPGLMDLAALRELADAPLPGGAFPPFTPRDALADVSSLWDAVREEDVLLHHPYDDFGSSVVRFFNEAADDPDVVAIKVALYRTGDRSPIAEALRRATESGKQVTVFVELKARFDEERNVRWTRRLEAAGAHVVHGLVGYKNHSKIALVMRRERDGVRRYAHVGTGNYNAATAQFYTDLGILTAREDVCDDVTDLFNALTGSTEPAATTFRTCLVAPNAMLTALLERIARERDHARAGRPARIRMKLNGLADREIVAALYDAARAGVTVDLVVRGVCTLAPGVAGVSDRIRVVSAVGRFLEHARIYAFDNDGSPDYFIGSADLRPRNLRRRVEVLVPVVVPAHRERLDFILDVELNDPCAWTLASDGSYTRRVPAPGLAASSAQAQFIGEVEHALRQGAS